MTKKEYMDLLPTKVIDEAKVNQVSSVYETSFPQLVQEIISSAEDSIFFDDGYRMLSIAEMIDAESDLHVQFKEKGMLPIADCDENDFIVFHFKDNFWSKFNIVDETVFKKKDSLAELLK